ncbi:MAG: hypothetical protein AAF573_00960 [Bacteroidota bacterium]
MYKYILERAGDIDWMAILPLLIFTIVFAVVVIMAMTHKKDFVNHMASLPLDENDSSRNVKSVEP